jgi:hypothetical protein
MRGQIGGLVEAPLAPARMVQRHGHDEISISEHGRTALAHECP